MFEGRHGIFFYLYNMYLTAKQISDILGGEVEGNPNVKIFGPSKIEEGKNGSITFLANPKYESYIYSTSASAILVAKTFSPKSDVQATLIRVEDVYSSIGMLINKFGESNDTYIGINNLASVDSTAEIAENVYIGPFCVIEKDAKVGFGTKLFPHTYIGANVRIGSNTIIYPGVKIYKGGVIGGNCIIHSNAVIGSDGFGFAPDQNGVYQKISQIGGVLIEDDVEIGANTVIDRATMGETIIRSGAKLDNLIQIGHNVEIGEHSVIAAQAGISGSTKIGKHCMIGGQAGFAGHIEIADRTAIQAQSGIMASVEEEGAKLFGYPAIPYHHYLRAYAVFKKLPELYKKVIQLNRKMEALTSTD